MNPYEYCAPATVSEAIALLAEKGERARPLAGGTDLIPQLRLGRFRLERVVDLKRIPELNQLAFDSTDGLSLGAAVPCCRIYEDERVCTAYPALVDAVAAIGGIAIQSRASVGGNLCNAASCANSAPPLLVLGATCEVAGPAGRRSLPLARFFTGSGRTALGPGELLVSVRVPAPPMGMGARYLRFSPRAEMDIAVVGVAASVALADDGATIRAAQVALSVVAATPILAEEAGTSLAGKPVSQEAVAAAAALARAAAHPRTTMRGTAEHRRHLVGVLTERALWDALRRARGEKLDGR
ncbi:MAG: FAD binding domain-containing protein [Anaerolineae bacterium]